MKVVQFLLDGRVSFHRHTNVYILRHDEGRGDAWLEEVGHFGADDEHTRLLQYGRQGTKRPEKAIAEPHATSIAIRAPLRQPPRRTPVGRVFGIETGDRSVLSQHGSGVREVYRVFSAAVGR